MKNGDIPMKKALKKLLSALMIVKFLLYISIPPSIYAEPPEDGPVKMQLTGKIAGGTPKDIYVQ